MFENNQRTELSEMGTFGLVEHISSFFKTKHNSSVRGIGDDAAVIDIGNEYLLMSSAHLLEGIHFDLAFHPLKHLGYKIVVAAISEICAMNGRPKEIYINLAVSNRFSLEAVEEIFSGVQVACDKFNLDLMGYQTSTASKGMFANITALGRVEKEKIAFRKGAKANDLLVVSGDLGGAYMGLQVLEREKKIFLEHPEMQPDLEKNDYIVGRQLRPEARLDVIEMLSALEIVPTSMIDVCDGVASEIHHLGSQSGVGFEIYEEKLPIDPQTVDRAIEFGLNPSIVALNGGEDFELLFTVDQKHFDKIKNNPDLSIIGYATEDKGAYHLQNRNGSSFDIKAQGWQKNN